MIWRQTVTRSMPSSIFESLTPTSVGARSRITQAATTGPARQPRPTSSVPAIALKPKSRSRRSIADISARRANSAKSWSRTRVRLSGFALLFDARGFSAEIPEVVELRTTDPAMTFHLDAIDRRRIERKHSLHTHSAGNFTHCEHLARPAALAGNDQALEDLDALFVAFLDLHVDFHRVSRLEIGDVGADLARLHY